ncbi:hypothetical protein KKF61_03190 [Patescibacteria group bacterium]|nr:hypothetical protein [Patescibacteria group bacterium]MBU0964251.1 hypothetical protein [Patescibacteria group bacterium]
MKQWESKKWIEFGKRPTTLLNRQFRKDWYLWVGQSTKLKVSQALIIGRDGVNAMYLLRREHTANIKQAEQDIFSGTAERILKKYFKRFKQAGLPGKNPADRAVYCHRYFGTLLLYSHYLEFFLTPLSQRLNGINKSKKLYINKLIKFNSIFRDTGVKLQDECFKSAERYLKTKYKKFGNVDSYLLEELFAGQKLNSTLISNRKKFFVQFATKKKNKVFIGRQAIIFLKKQGFFQHEIGKIKSIKGFPAYNGIITGEVRIIKTLKDCKQIHKGDIVVTYMTTVHYLPYLKGIKAIVTDEGGINCHAAVTSRELKIPCIVGTKIASKVLKNGDRVEVDANKGVVKKV